MIKKTASFNQVWKLSYEYQFEKDFTIDSGIFIFHFAAIWPLYMSVFQIHPYSLFITNFFFSSSSVVHNYYLNFPKIAGLISLNETVYLSDWYLLDLHFYLTCNSFPWFFQNVHLRNFIFWHDFAFRKTVCRYCHYLETRWQFGTVAVVLFYQRYGKDGFRSISFETHQPSMATFFNTQLCDYFEYFFKFALVATYFNWHSQFYTNKK